MRRFRFCSPGAPVGLRARGARRARQLHRVRATGLFIVYVGNDLTRSARDEDAMTDKYKKILIGSIIGIPAAIFAAVVAGWIGQLISTPEPGATPTVAASEVELDEPTLRAAGPGTPTATGDPASEAPAVFAPVTVELSDSVATQSCKRSGNSGFGWNDGVGTIAGVGYVGGFRCLMGYSPALGYVDFTVPAGATEFSTTVGQSDDASWTGSVVRFEIIDVANGSVLAVSDLAFAQSALLEVQVTSTVRLRLQASTTTPADETSTWASFGDPTFR